MSVVSHYKVKTSSVAQQRNRQLPKCGAAQSVTAAWFVRAPDWKQPVAVNR